MKIVQLNEYEKAIILNDEEIAYLCECWLELIDIEKIDRHARDEYFSDRVSAYLPKYPFISFSIVLDCCHNVEESDYYYFHVIEEEGVESFIDVKSLNGKERIKWKYETANFDYYLADESFDKIVNYIDDFQEKNHGYFQIN